MSRSLSKERCLTALSPLFLSSDLFWEQHYTPIPMPGHEQDEVFDAGLSEYPLPEQIERLIDAGTLYSVLHTHTWTELFSSHCSLQASIVMLKIV